MSRATFLFSEVDLGASLRSQEKAMVEAAQAIPADHAVASSAEDLAAELVARFKVEPIVLDGTAVTVSHHDERIDVSGDRMRFVSDRSRPFFIPGTTVTYHVPFRGEVDLFKARASNFTLSPPVGTVVGGEVQVSATVPAPVPTNIKERLDQTLATIKTHLDWVNADVRAFNERLAEAALTAAQGRRQKVIADHDLVASFGIPIRRADAPRTYAAPPARRAVVRPHSPSGATAGPLEPVLPPEEYDHILDVARQMGTVLERSPKAFAGMDEETLRQHLLVQLNGQYEGDATGETFNFEGKTDILIRRAGRNLFIAECKFWDGPESLSKTIDQILGYASWRDTKTAIFIFNRRRDLSKVLSQISPTVRDHPNYVREVKYGQETDFRFVIRHRDDAERELTLSVLVFEVPS